MKKMLLMQLINVFMSMLTPNLIRQFADNVLDFVEDFVAGTKSEVDDNIVLPLCDMIRVTFNVPDDE